MENATKALLIIASVFLSLMLISLLVYMGGQISNYIEEKNTNEIIRGNNKI